LLKVINKNKNTNNDDNNNNNNTSVSHRNVVNFKKQKRSQITDSTLKHRAPCPRSILPD